jgi:hypothetical protein
VAAKDRMNCEFDRLRFKQWFHHKLRIQQARDGGRADCEESQKASINVANTGQIGFANATTIPVFGGCGIQVTGGTAGLFANTVDTVLGTRMGVLGAGQIWPPIEQRHV